MLYVQEKQERNLYDVDLCRICGIMRHCDHIEVHHDGIAIDGD